VKLKARSSRIETAPGNSGTARVARHRFSGGASNGWMGEVASGIKGAVKPSALVVSLAPKFTIAKAD